jgi:hypothetical protein
MVSANSPLLPPMCWWLASWPVAQPLPLCVAAPQALPLLFASTISCCLQLIMMSRQRMTCIARGVFGRTAQQQSTVVKHGQQQSTSGEYDRMAAKS